MERIVDGKGESLEAGEGTLLGEVLDAARLEALRDGRVVVEMKVDGRVVDSGAEEKLKGRPVSEVEMLEVRTRVPGELASETLLELSRHMERVEENVEGIVGHLEANRVSEAMELLGGCCNIWGVLQEAMVRIGVLLGLKYDEMEVEGKSVGDWITGLKELLEGVNEALQNRDFVSLGDILRYGLSPAMRNWREITLQLAEQISPSKGA